MRHSCVLARMQVQKEFTADTSILNSEHNEKFMKSSFDLDIKSPYRNDKTNGGLDVLIQRVIRQRNCITKLDEMINPIIQKLEEADESKAHGIISKNLEKARGMIETIKQKKEKFCDK